MKNIFCIASVVLVLFSCQKEEARAELNLELKKELAEIGFADQALRTMTNETTADTIRRLAAWLKEDTAFVKRYYKSLQTRSDRENIEQILKIIEQYGYPGKKLVGEPENAVAWIIIQHSRPEELRKNMPLLRTAAQNGDIDYQWLAMSEDRNLMYQGKEQIFGSQLNTFNGKTIIWPIQNPEKVNELRKEAGFVQTLEEYGKMVLGDDFKYENYSVDEVKINYE